MLKQKKRMGFLVLILSFLTGNVDILEKTLNQTEVIYADSNNQTETLSAEVLENFSFADVKSSIMESREWSKEKQERYAKIMLQNNALTNTLLSLRVELLNNLQTWKVKFHKFKNETLKLQSEINSLLSAE